MIEMYYGTRDGMGGLGAYPEPGGYMDQLAIVTEAFRIIGALEGERRQADEDGRDDGRP